MTKVTNGLQVAVTFYCYNCTQPLNIEFALASKSQRFHSIRCHSCKTLNFIKVKQIKGNDDQ